MIDLVQVSLPWFQRYVVPEEGENSRRGKDWGVSNDESAQIERGFGTSFIASDLAAIETEAKEGQAWCALEERDKVGMIDRRYADAGVGCEEVEVSNVPPCGGETLNECRRESDVCAGTEL
jgi:hypothetical protein